MSHRFGVSHQEALGDVAVRGSVGMERAAKKKPQPFSTGLISIRSPVGVFHGAAKCAPAPGRRPCGHITRIWLPPPTSTPPPPPDTTPALAPAPGGGALAPALGHRAGAERPAGSERAAGAGSGAVSAGPLGARRRASREQARAQGSRRRRRRGGTR